MLPEMRNETFSAPAPARSSDWRDVISRGKRAAPMRSSLLVLGSAALLTLVISSGCSGSDAPPPAGATPTTNAATIPEDDAGAPETDAQTDAAAPDPGTKGCGVAPKGTGTFAARTLTANGKSRTYHLAVPAGAKQKQALPLVFVLHGATDTAPENMRDWFGVEGKLTTPSLAVYPLALERTRSDGSGGKVTRWDLSGNDDLAFFDAMLAEIGTEYCVDRAHVFVTGFSSGGNFSQHLACERQKDVKGMAVVAGPGPFSDTCGGAVPTWMTHDKDDDALPVADARSSRDFWAAQNGCKTSTWSAVTGRPECQRNTSCPAGEPLVYCESSGVGHNVPDYAVDEIGGFFSSLVK
jgi:polyhydroxybutyrate depolymerase